MSSDSIRSTELVPWSPRHSLRVHGSFDNLPRVSGAAAQLATDIRKTVLTESMRANVGHIGSCLSIADVVAVLYSSFLGQAGTDDRERNRFVLSKGHAALALYAALHHSGLLADEISTFCDDGSRLATHPEHVVPGIDFSTGSLGQGLSIGAGAALAARMQRSPRQTFVLVSDAECNEGALWEAAMFAAHHKLANLVAIVDANGQQALGYTTDVLDLAPLGNRFRAFGWDVHDVDGHDVEQLARVIEGLDTHAGPPHVLVAATTFGKGVSFMEGLIEWHYLPLTDAQFRTGMTELEGVEA
jgi:transketolase